MVAANPIEFTKRLEGLEQWQRCGNEVALAAGTEVDLAAGAEVALAAGTEVDLAAGAEVALAAGTEVDLAAGATVAVSSVAAGEEHIGTVGGNTVVARTTITRPADTNAYAIGDAWADSTSAPTVPSITAARVAGGTGRITGLKAILSANQATKAALQVLVFDTTFTALEDNAAMDLSDAEAARLVGAFLIIGGDWIATNAGAGAAGNLVTQVEVSEPAAFECVAGSQNLYVAVRLVNAYTPVSGEALTLLFDVEQN